MTVGEALAMIGKQVDAPLLLAQRRVWLAVQYLYSREEWPALDADDVVPEWVKIMIIGREVYRRTATGWKFDIQGVA